MKSRVPCHGLGSCMAALFAQMEHLSHGAGKRGLKSLNEWVGREISTFTDSFRLSAALQ